MRDWSSSYRKIIPSPNESGPGEAWLSPAPSDPWWDDFLRSTPCGQFQQSSLWAEYKAGEGWHHHRVVLTDTPGIMGGFQILWKKSRLGRIGYVSKGPVAQPEDPALVHQLGRLLRGAARELGLTALIVQPPDESKEEPGSPDVSGFLISNPLQVVEATYLVDVSTDMETVRQRMHSKVRQYVRKSRQAGVVIRPGTEADLPLFFALMAATCRRQHTRPNPASLEAVRRLWKIFSPRHAIEMSFAEKAGTAVAGRLNLIFGDRVTQWKKGWDGSAAGSRPNEFLADHALEWAQGRGYRICDFTALNRLTALRLLGGQTQNATHAHSRDKFNLRLGGYPKLLPRARLLVPNPIIHWGYQHTYVRYEHYREHRLLMGMSSDNRS